MRFTTQSSWLIVTFLLAGCSTFVQVPGTPLARAAHDGNIDEIRRLIAAGADPNEYDASHQTPLHWAARGGHPLGPHRCPGDDEERAEVVAALIDLGANPNAADQRMGILGRASGWTPLHMALRHEQFKTAARLIERGANPLLRSGQGITALAMAANEGAPKALLTTIVSKHE